MGKADSGLGGGYAPAPQESRVIQAWVVRAEGVPPMHEGDPITTEKHTRSRLEPLVAIFFGTVRPGFWSAGSSTHPVGCETLPSVHERERWRSVSGIRKGNLTPLLNQGTLRETGQITGPIKQLINGAQLCFFWV